MTEKLSKERISISKKSRLFTIAYVYGPVYLSNFIFHHSPINYFPITVFSFRFQIVRYVGALCLYNLQGADFTQIAAILPHSFKAQDNQQSLPTNSPHSFPQFSFIYGQYFTEIILSIYLYFIIFLHMLSKSQHFSSHNKNPRRIMILSYSSQGSSHRPINCQH